MAWSRRADLCARYGAGVGAGDRAVARTGRRVRQRGSRRGSRRRTRRRRRWSRRPARAGQPRCTADFASPRPGSSRRGAVGSHDHGGTAIFGDPAHRARRVGERRRGQEDKVGRRANASWYGFTPSQSCRSVETVMARPSSGSRACWHGWVMETWTWRDAPASRGAAPRGSRSESSPAADRRRARAAGPAGRRG